MLKLEVSLAIFGFPTHFTYESPNILPHIDLAAAVRFSYPPSNGRTIDAAIDVKIAVPPVQVYGEGGYQGGFSGGNGGGGVGVGRVIGGGGTGGGIGSGAIGSGC
jgi:hypothetical protein